jgi:hypothetical protein
LAEKRRGGLLRDAGNPRNHPRPSKPRPRNKLPTERASQARLRGARSGGRPGGPVPWLPRGRAPKSSAKAWLGTSTRTRAAEFGTVSRYVFSVVPRLRAYSISYLRRSRVEPRRRVTWGVTGSARTPSVATGAAGGGPAGAWGWGRGRGPRQEGPAGMGGQTAGWAGTAARARRGDKGDGPRHGRAAGPTTHPPIHPPAPAPLRLVPCRAHGRARHAPPRPAAARRRAAAGGARHGAGAWQQRSGAAARRPPAGGACERRCAAPLKPSYLLLPHASPIRRMGVSSRGRAGGKLRSAALERPGSALAARIGRNGSLVSRGTRCIAEAHERSGVPGTCVGVASSPWAAVQTGYCGSSWSAHPLLDTPAPAPRQPAVVAHRVPMHAGARRTPRAPPARGGSALGGMARAPCGLPSRGYRVSSYQLPPRRRHKVVALPRPHASVVALPRAAALQPLAVGRRQLQPRVRLRGWQGRRVGGARHTPPGRLPRAAGAGPRPQTWLPGRPALTRTPHTQRRPPRTCCLAASASSAALQASLHDEEHAGRRSGPVDRLHSRLFPDRTLSPAASPCISGVSAASSTALMQVSTVNPRVRDTTFSPSSCGAEERAGRVVVSSAGRVSGRGGGQSRPHPTRPRPWGARAPRPCPTNPHLFY